MCGIIGYLSRQSGGCATFSQSIPLLRHRGPDDNGIWQGEDIQMGSTRLAILDLSALGHQPMPYSEGRYYIVFNGEIYNYLELRDELERLGHRFKSRTDTEVVLAGFTQWGQDCLHKLRGMFAFAIWDLNTRTLFLARDRVGEKPLYYWHDDKSFCFASELKALLAILPQKPALDPAAVDLYLHYQYVPEPMTPLSGVWKLPASNYLSISLKDWVVTPRQYWNLENVCAVSGDPIKLIREEINRIIKLTLRSDVPVGIALSGGIDSGALASLAAQNYKDTLCAFTVGYQKGGPYDERNQAKNLAKILKIPWFDIELKTNDFVAFFPDMVAIMDEPIADIAGYGHYAVNRLAADHGVKVLLNGLGGDELFWGYPWIIQSALLTQRKQKILRSSSYNKKSNSLRKICTSPGYLKLLLHPSVPKAVKDLLLYIAGDNLLSLDHPGQAVFYADLVPEFVVALNNISGLYTKEFASLIPNRNPYRNFEFDISGAADIPVKIYKLLFDTWLVSNCLSLQDRVSMSCSVEARVPLLDYRLVELVIGLMKGSNGHIPKNKTWLKSALEGVLPKEVMGRTKRGFQPPVAEWSAAIIDKYKQKLLSGYLIEAGIIDANAVNKFLKSRKGRGHILYKLLFLEIWYRRVVLGRT